MNAAVNVFVAIKESMLFFWTIAHLVTTDWTHHHVTPQARSKSRRAYAGCLVALLSLA